MTDESGPNNPAARLQAMLDRAGAVGGPALEAWSIALEIPPERSFDVFEHVVDLRALPARAEELIKTIPGLPHERLLNWVPPITNVINASFTNTSHNWNDLQRQINGEHRQTLAICADLLAHHVPEPSLAPADIAAIHQDVWQLRERTIGADLDADVKEFLLQQLEQLDHALQRYRVRGLDALKTGIQELAGRTLAQRDVAQRSRLTKAGDAFFKLVDRVNSLSKLRENLPAWVALFFALCAMTDTPLPDFNTALKLLESGAPPPAIEHYEHLPLPAPGQHDDSDTTQV